MPGSNSLYLAPIVKRSRQASDQGLVMSREARERANGEIRPNQIHTNVERIIMEDEMDVKKILAACDHTLLRQEAGWEDIRELIDEAIEFGTASVCIPPAYVRPAAEYAGGRMRICTVTGFPNGNMTTATKVFETKDAIENGADEIDMVINIGRLKSGDGDYVLDEIRQAKEACGEHVLKVIIETCLLTESEKILACGIVTDSA